MQNPMEEATAPPLVKSDRLLGKSALPLAGQASMYPYANPFARFSESEIAREDGDDPGSASWESVCLLWSRSLSLNAQSRQEHLCERRHYDDALASGERIE